MAKPIDIVVTWPKTRSLQSYLDALYQTQRHGGVINYRVARRPDWEFGSLVERDPRCYRVHSGYVRGWTTIKFAIYREDNEVIKVGTEEYWPAGNYVVCNPYWHSLAEPIPMRGFQGWRWFEEEMARERARRMS